MTLASGKAFEGFVTEHGLRHVALDVDLLERLQSPEGKEAVSGKKLLTTMKRPLPCTAESSIRSGPHLKGPTPRLPSKGPGRLPHRRSFGGTRLFSHPIPMFSPTRAFPNPVLPVTNLGGVLNRFSYEAFLRFPTAPYHRTINRWRKETLKLAPTSLLASELEVRGRPVQRLLCCSSYVVPPPQTGTARLP